VPRHATAWTILLAGLTFVLLAIGVLYLEFDGIVGRAEAQLMLVSLLGLYVGIGILVSVYLLVDKLK